MHEPIAPDTVLVIGAGAAGLAAARRLREAGAAPLLIEARPRIGGRVWTDRSFGPAPIEHGAELVHGAGTITVALARAAGLELAPVDRYGGLRWSPGGPARPLAQLDAQTCATIAALRAAYRELPAQIAPADHLPDPAADRSLADYLRARGFDAAALAIADVLLAQTCCAAAATLSCADLARELIADRAGPDEFRIPAGYDALLSWMARDLELVAGAAVSRVTWGASGVMVEAGGRSYRGQRCIISVPVGVLQAGTIRFEPALSEPRRRAICAFRVEAATKLFYRFDAPLWDPGLVYMAHDGVVARWWTPLHHAPNRPVICAYITAARARQVDALSESAALAMGLAELGALLGVPDIARHCLEGRRISWANDPYACGGYAHVPPGAAAARPTLAAPEGDRLFFAGEATAYQSNPQTVHGAIESGLRAAEECLAGL